VFRLPSNGTDPPIASQVGLTRDSFKNTLEKAREGQQ
jgi:hypothetical protein